MQISASQTGISSERLRFSHCAVPVGNVPSTGNALTGSSSPWPAIIGPSVIRTKAGASAGTGGTRSKVLVITPGTTTSCRCASDWSIASKFLLTTAAPRFRYDFSTERLIAVIASSRGSTPEMAKKQGCITVLMRDPIPRSRAILWASIT